jgi:hypothetical protein
LARFLVPNSLDIALLFPLLLFGVTGGAQGLQSSIGAEEQGSALTMGFDVIDEGLTLACYQALATSAGIGIS